MWVLFCGEEKKWDHPFTPTLTSNTFGMEVIRTLSMIISVLSICNEVHFPLVFLFDCQIGDESFFSFKYEGCIFLLPFPLDMIEMTREPLLSIIPLLLLIQITHSMFSFQN